LSIGCVYAQQVPRLFIQGALKDANGAAVPDGTYSVLFGLYDTELDGAANWNETATVTTKGGLYSHYLGSVNPLVSTIFDQTQFLGVKVGAFEMEPRTELTYAPYTFKSFQAIFADKVVCSGAVGDLKYSVLNPTQFAQENGDCWVPLNGGTAAGTALGATLGISTLPNVSGLFLRAQEFMNALPSPNNDPDPGRTFTSPIAVLQNDTYKSHNHGGETNETGAHEHSLANVPFIGNPSSNVANNKMKASVNVKTLNPPPANLPGGSHSHSIQSVANTGGVETRPKNMNLFVYIRVN
jgi:hypothetical protein